MLFIKTKYSFGQVVCIEKPFLNRDNRWEMPLLRYGSNVPMTVYIDRPFYDETDCMRVYNICVDVMLSKTHFILECECGGIELTAIEEILTNNE